MGERLDLVSELARLLVKRQVLRMQTWTMRRRNDKLRMKITRLEARNERLREQLAERKSSDGHEP